LVRVNSAAELLFADIESLPLARLQGVDAAEGRNRRRQVQSLACGTGATWRPGPSTMPIVALIETALGVLRARKSPPRIPAVCALGFGAEDYAAEMSVEPKGESLLWPPRP
jgi:citrate lyase subunit beta/citryl-CoA lyase